VERLPQWAGSLDARGARDLLDQFNDLSGRLPARVATEKVDNLRQSGHKRRERCFSDLGLTDYELEGSRT
jgi:hypothetical protein